MYEALIDFETRSRLSLKHTNCYKYAAHPSTQALCMAYSIDDGPRKVWRLGEPFPLADIWPYVYFPSFNAEFELVIWRLVCTPKLGWPELKPSQVECLQARAAYTGLPRKLEIVGSVLGLGEHGKDKAGNLNMLRLCKPLKGKLIGCEYVGGRFDDNDERHNRNAVYSCNDVETEQLVKHQTVPLPKAERRLWLVHQKINERGVPVDLNLCRNASQLVLMEQKQLCKELLEVTDGEVRTPNCLEKFKDWLTAQDYKLLCMQEETIEWALAGKSGVMPPKVKQALTIRKLYRNSAVTKYQAVLNHAEADAYCRAAHVFYKAGPGRFAGAGVNFLNLTRLNEDLIPQWVTLADRLSEATQIAPFYEELSATKQFDKAGCLISGGVIPTLGAMVRMAVCSHPGKVLISCDYKSIEMRGLHWLAGDAKMLQSIRDFDNGIGEEPYKIAAANIFEKDVKDIVKAERQCGKVQILGCGYMTGAAKFQAFAESAYGIVMTLERAKEIVDNYRKSNPIVVKLWYSLGKAVIRCVRNRRTTQVGLLEFNMDGDTLDCRLPSGRLLKYYKAGLEDGPYGDELVAVDQRSGGRRAIGLPTIVENMVQATCRDLLADALVKGNRANLPIVLHVYDSAMAEVPGETAIQDGQTLLDIMRDTPKWAVGLPVDGDLTISKRMY